MKFRCFFLLLALLAIPPAEAFGQKLEKLTGLQIEYWRAFDGVIKQTVLFSGSGEVTLNTTITPNYPQLLFNDSGDATPNTAIPKSNHTVKTISVGDLAPVLAIFNDADTRQFFASTEPELMADGAVLSITAVQNSFSISFSSQEAFSGSPSLYHTGLGRVALALFKLAGVSIPKEKLY